MAWYRLAFRPAVVQDLAAIALPMAQRLFDKTKWLASNADNLRHLPVQPDFPTLSKYAVGDWRIFYSIDHTGQVVDIHRIVQETSLHI